MKMHMKSFLVLSVLLLCGFSVHLNAQVSGTLVHAGTTDKTLQGKNWVSSSLAIQIAQVEKTQLTAQQQMLVQSGASTQEIGKVATRLEFYSALLVALQSGMTVAEAFAGAWAYIGGGTDSASAHPFFSAQDFEELYQSALAKLTN